MKNNNPSIRHPDKRSRGAIALRTAITVTLLVLTVAVLGGASFIKLYKPSVDTDVPFMTGTEQPPVEPIEPSDTTSDAEEPVTTEPVETQGGSFTRDTEIVNFLVVGRDAESWNTDVIMLVNFNMREGGISVMQLPRDTYIEINGSRGRVNSLLAKFYNSYRAENKSAKQNELIADSMSSLCELLEKSLCIQIDGYAHVNLEGFRGIVNAIGGVYMDVPSDMDYEDPEQDLYIHLKAGPQLLDGEKAEMFVRFREGYVQADIGRIDAQKLFLTALFKQIKSTRDVSTVAKLAEQVYKYVITDVPLADIIIYAKELLGVDMGNISMMTLHGTATQTETGAWYYIINRAATLDMINSYFNVYDTPISDAIFDPTAAFTDESSAIFKKVYLADPDDAAVQVKPNVMTGDDIDKGELDIYYVTG